MKISTLSLAALPLLFSAVAAGPPSLRSNQANRALEAAVELPKMRCVVEFRYWKPGYPEYPKSITFSGIETEGKIFNNNPEEPNFKYNCIIKEDFVKYFGGNEWEPVACDHDYKSDPKCTKLCAAEDKLSCLYLCLPYTPDAEHKPNQDNSREILCSWNGSTKCT